MSRILSRIGVTPTRSRLYFALLCLLPLRRPGLAQTKAPDLTNVSIEDLMNIEVTSVSHKEQRVGDVAAAVSVITRRTSGGRA